MEIRTEILRINGALPKAENPQPRFRCKDRDVALFHDGSLRAEELVRYGAECRERVLPYRMQDRYTRAEEPLEIPAVVLENQHLRATFLPGYGGKLWSLYAKDRQRELLFVNPVFRPANLAIRNAWIAGGIEWNLGHMGHSAFTCGELFCAKVVAPGGETFLRMYEYEAAHAQLLQMDFHLPDGARQLAMHVRITNAREQEALLYWWTNTAVALTPGTRVFSGTGEIIYQLTPNPTDKIPGFGRCQMPRQPNLACDDISYPWRIPHSVEYFFQNEPGQLAPWEVSAEADGQGFFERSTQPLYARKMFCWGMAPGGRHWCDFLAKEGQGDYIEIQAGLAPTQNHTALLAAGETVCFTQLFGAFEAPPAAQDESWDAAKEAVEQAVETALPAKQVQALHEEYAAQALLETGELLHTGSLYGGLENARRAKENRPPLAAHLPFPATGREAEAWQGVLEGRALPESSPPLPFVVDPLWGPYLEAVSTQSEEGAYQYAVLLAENGRDTEAAALFERLAEQGHAFATYARGSLQMREGQAAEAAPWFQKAWALAGEMADPSFAEGWLQALLGAGEYARAWEAFGQMPQKTETARLLASEAAVKLGEWAFLEEAFGHEFAVIREGALGLGDIWFEYQARKAAGEKGIPFEESQIDRSLPLPRHLDFRMFE